ncbi:5-formyltetrahydrofolate cyclo-ligase [Denitrovibrio acetiphilus DSM 12809]|uniref:5-formyltetrahydrofolate cyclo-ligase n=2 Tax=Denitrovibrio TaxID=117999 RepID=D4H123_DENA2|nr:5-formyltetrahydrofolate cyclo-ligase [Denitrovibrio acetiphilus DSM 12809]
MSDAVAERFLKEFGDFDSYLLYSSFKSEVETHSLIKYLYGMKKTVYLPVVSGDELKLGSYKGEASLSSGAFGIQEPVECTDFKHIDIAVVPGVAFDRALHRIGYGKGYYDRLLGAVRFGIIAGFAFECQLFDSFDHEPHDIPVDVLVTENDIYRRNS